MKNNLIFFLFIGLFIFFSNDLKASIYPYETPVKKYLKSIEITELESGVENIDCIYVINLDERPEKWERVKPSFDKKGIKVNRVSGINGWQLSAKAIKELMGPYHKKLPPGHIGCILSHVSILKDAYDRGFNLIWIMEDDAEFLDDVNLIPPLITSLSQIDPQWDVFYTDKDFRNNKGGYTKALAIDPRPEQEVYPLDYYLEKTLITKDIMKINQRYGMHSILISRNGIKKILDYFTHVYLWTSVDIDIHYVPDIRQYSCTRDIVSNFRVTPSDTSMNSFLNSENTKK